MKKILLPLLFLSVLSCKKEEITDTKEINTLIFSATNLPDPPQAKPATVVGTKSIIITDNNDITQNCQEVTYSYANNMDKIIAFNPNAGSLFPSSLVQGKFVRNGELVSIGSFSRNPITLTLDEYGISKTIENPNNANVSKAIIEMIGENTVSTIAKIDYKQTEAHTTEQGLLSLGIDYTWANASIGANMSISNTTKQNSVYIYFLQNYYTVSINQPSKPSDFFASDVNIEDLKYKISNENPLCYVSSVTYGRMLIAKITSTETMNELVKSVNGSFNKLNGKLSYTNNSIINNSTIQVYVLGGNSDDAINAATQGMSGIVNYMNNGSNFSKESLGTPISYVVKYASDNSTIKMGSALEYTVKDNCITDLSSVQKFKFTMEDIYIKNDCDTWSDNGEFTYDFNIKDNSTTLYNISNKTIQEISDGEYLDINAGPYDIVLSKENNHKLIIDGCLYQHDSGSINEKLCLQKIEHSSPWNDIENTPTSFSVPLPKVGSCDATLYYSIQKID